MTLVLTADQKDLVDVVRDFSKRSLAPHAIEWDQKKYFPVDVLREAGELGLGSVYVPEERGGSGLSRLDAALIFEQLGKGDPSIAAYISIHNMVVWMIDHHGTDEQREKWVTPLLNMEQLGAYCLSEPDAGSDAAALRTSAVRDGDHYVINGTKQFISGAGVASTYVVMARTGGPGHTGTSAIVVPDGTPGLSFGENERKMGWNAQPTRQVVFEDVRVPVANRLGEEGTGFLIAMNGLNGGRLNVAACSLGGAQWALERSIEHLNARTAFGKPLIEHQALLFQLADMATELEAARALLMHAASAYDRGDKDAVVQCAMAKRFVTDTAFAVANSALQLHGGYGYLADYGIEKVVRDLRVHQIVEGSNEIMKLIVGRAVSEGAR